ncbi:protein TolA [Paracoccus sp. Z118]|uniref:protein TolA n=1 Tax=Paracoccus sp. Z118 TaxID=2851017 RepID=UPI001C2C9643|nr:protein TolA [Paracoccus sp. Z118]MBV0891316.1 protein TolA [Paracoccus sp. Z118]
MERADRIGAWVSGVAHVSLIAWVAIGGALFRGQPSAAIRMTNVQTMSDAEFQQLAAAARGAGPVGEFATVQPAQPRPPSDEVVAGGSVSVAPPAEQVDPLAMPAPEIAPEAAPDLSDLRAPQEAVAVATIAPIQPDTPFEAPGTVTVPDAAPGRAVAMATPRPMRPDAPTAEAPAAQPAPPPPPGLAPLTSQTPLAAAEARLRLAERQAAAQAELLARQQAEAAAAEAARQVELQRQAEAEAAEAAREAELARQAEAEAARQAEAEAAAAEAARQAAAEADAEAAPQAALEAELRAEEERAAAEAAARELAEAAAAQAAAEEEARRAEAEAQARAEAEAQAAREEQERIARAEAEAREAEAAAAREAARVEAERRAVEEAAREQAEAERREQERLAAEAAAEEQARADELAARAEAEAEAREQAERERLAPADDALAAALAQALNDDLPPEGAGAEGGGGRAETGPPLTSGERDGLRVAIQECWNAGALSREAASVRVSVGFSMTPDGLPQTDTIELIESDGGSPQAAQQAFEVARRAIIRCGLQNDGYDLPADKYGRWKDVIVDFTATGSGISLR